MNRLALAVVLSISIAHFTFAQRTAGGGSTSSSSGSSSGSSGSSSGGGGGYSGGSSHSTGGGAYSGGGGYSGGGSSHSSASSGGYSGGSHSSGGYSGGSSSHSAGGSHSGGYAPSHTGSGSPHSSTGNTSAHSNVRNSTASFEHLGGATNQPSGTQWKATSGPQSGHVPTADFQTKQTSSGPQWMHQSFMLDLPTGPGLNKGLSKHEFDSKLQSVGLEPSKSAYRDKLSAFRGADNGHRPNWVARLFGAKNPARDQIAAPKLRPCITKECKPLPVPPKPCAGPKCPAPPPTPTPVNGVCSTGYDSNGYCLPWGYLERCSTYGDGCYVRFSWVSTDYCRRILQEIRRQQASYNQLRLQQQSVCSATPQNQECVRAAQEMKVLESNLVQLQRQYQLCRTATAWVPVDWDLADASSPSTQWPSSWTFFWPPFF